MTNKTTKKALVVSLFSLLLCFSMLLGTTFAWFTDSVTSAGNIIQSGTLDVTMEWAEGSANPAAAAWTDASAGPIFNNKLWEPGYTEVRHIKIANVGTLALKYAIVIEATGEVEDLAEVIDVYVIDPAAQIEDRTDLAGITPAGTLKDVIANISELSAAALLAGENNTITVALKMRDEAGNEYQNKKIGDSFAIKLIATQMTAESDSFDEYYDGGAKWLGGIDTTWYDANATEFIIGTPEQLAGLAAITNGYADVADDFAGKTIILASNLDLNNINWTPIGDPMSESDSFAAFAGTFDGNGYTISNLYINNPTAWGQGLFGYTSAAVTVKNLNVRNANVLVGDNGGIIYGMCYGYSSQSVFSNIHVTGDVSVVGTSPDGYIGGIVGYGYHSNFEDCSVISDGGVIASEARFVGGIVGYQCNNAKTIKNCAVEGLNITGYVAVGGISGIVQTGGTAIDNCSVKNVVINMTRVEGYPAIGALIGNYSGTAATTLTGKVENVTLNGYHIPYEAYNVLYGSNYDGATNPNFDVTGVIGVDTVVNNLATVAVATPATVQDMINAAAAGDIIALGEGTYDIIVMKSGITLVGTGSATVGCVNLNGSDGVTLKGITFDAAGAQAAYYNASKVQIYSNVISSNPTSASGAQNLVIDGCTFSGTFEKGGAAISFVDYGRKSGYAGNVTIKNCTFDVENAYYDIYGYYCGNGKNGNGNFVIENNVFASTDLVAGHVYLGRYASSTPVVVKGNTFEDVASLGDAMYVQDHSSYGVSINAENNKFAG